MNDQDRIFPYNINTISSRKHVENKKMYPLGDYKLIQNQTLRTNIISIEWQPVRRIPNEILGVKEITGEY